jgi:hypothetical protein
MRPSAKGQTCRKKLKMNPQIQQLKEGLGLGIEVFSNGRLLFTFMELWSEEPTQNYPQGF